MTSSARETAYPADIRVAEADLTIIEPHNGHWLSLVEADPQASIFHHPVWMELLAECYGFRPFVAAVYGHNGQIAAGLPFMEVNTVLSRRRWVALPFSDHCAPLHRDPASLRQLVDGLASLAYQSSTLDIEIRWAIDHRAAKSHSDHVLHVLELGDEAGAVASRFHRMHSRNIDIALKKGVRVELGNTAEHVETFYRLHVDTRRRQGIPVQPVKFFRLLARRLIEPGLGYVLLAYFGSECVAASVYLHWNRTLTYKFGASQDDSLSLRPNNLLFWEAIRWGCEQGYTTLDMGRTGIENTGLRDFKSRWGAQETPLTYSVLSPRDARFTSDGGLLMPVMQGIIRKSPKWVCRAIGELLYRHFA